MKVVLTVIIICLFTFCKNQPAPNISITTNAEEADTTKFFEVTPFIQGQIADVKKTPYSIYRLLVINDRKDSTQINSEAFSTLAQKFLQPNITTPSLKKFYKENLFFDQTTKTFTLSYTTTQKDLEIQNIDVLLHEDGETVKRIFIRKFYSYPDSSATEQLIWKPNERFQIIRLTQSEDNKETSRQDVVVWNEKG